MWFTLLVTLTYDFVSTKHCIEIFSQGAFLFSPVLKIFMRISKYQYPKSKVDY